MSRSRRSVHLWLALALTGVASTAAAEEPQVEHAVAGGYVAEVSMFTDGTTSAAAAALSGDLDYEATLLGDEGQSLDDVEAGAGLSLGRMEGTISSTQANTRAHLRIGPAAVSPSEDRFNMAYLPLTFELEHDGELGALPRLSSRPDANRAVLSRGQVSLATRAIRVEVGGEDVPKDSWTPSGGKPPERISSAIDFITLFGDVEATAQDGTRIEAGIGGAMLSVTNHHTHGERVDVFALEHRATRLLDGTTTSLGTLWALRASLTNPTTGSTYTLGWGVALGGPYDELSTPTEENPSPDLSIGGLGWWSEKSWGGFGFQLLREPFVSMAGEHSLDDRGWIEVWLAGDLGISARGYVARTQRKMEGAWTSEWSTGLEVGGKRKVAGVDLNLSLELGQTHYAELDGGRPKLGFAARGLLSLSRSGRRSWVR